MTEKRFRLGYVCGDYGLIDNDDDEWIDFHSMSENSEKNVKICLNKMNELADENEHYKSIFETVNGWYMENSKQKVELDDIVGLVKIDEPTDSVQLKKEAQLSICEKRIIELENENEQLKQQIGNLEHTRDFCAECCERLEKENEELKFEIREVQRAYEQLWEHTYK